MTEKELRKLKRSDFLQLLLTQGKDMAAVQSRLEETTRELVQLKETCEQQKSEISEKDGIIANLEGIIGSKDATIAALRQEIEDMKAIMSALRLIDAEKDDTEGRNPYEQKKKKSGDAKS